MISTNLEQISAAERTDGLPWVDLGVGGWPAERQQSVWETNMRQKCAPLHERASKIRTLRQKVDVELKDARVGWRLEGGKNCYPSSESVLKMRPLRQKVDARVG